MQTTKPTTSAQHQRAETPPATVTVNGRRRLIDADVLAPLHWGELDQHQLEQLDAIRGAGL